MLFGSHRARLGSLLGLLVSVLLAAVATGCDDAGQAKNSSSQISHDAASSDGAPTHLQATHPGSYLKLDGDLDNDDEPHPVKAEADELPLLRHSGGKASPADARAISTLVKSFYAASAAVDGARTCSLMHTGLASALAAQHSERAHETCAEAMSVLLRREHRRLLSEDVSTMVVISVHVKGDLGLAVLGFRATPESQIVVEREGQAWKIDTLFGTYMP